MTQRPIAPNHHGDQPHRDHHRGPPVHRRSGWAQTSEENHTGLDHRGGVEERTGRRRGDHCCRKPAVERELCRLGHGAHQDEQPPDGRGGCRFDQSSDVGRAGLKGEKNQTRQEGKATTSRRQDRPSRCSPSGTDAVVMTDQEVGSECGELPKDEKSENVVTDDDAGHGQCKDQHHCRETGVIGTLAEVSAGEGENRDAYDAYDYQQQHRQRVRAERELQADASHPRPPRCTGPGDHS